MKTPKAKTTTPRKPKTPATVTAPAAAPAAPIIEDVAVVVLDAPPALKPASHTRPDGTTVVIH